MSNINPYDLSAVRRAAPSGRKETTRDILYRYLPWRKDRFSRQTETAIIEALEYLVKLKITQPDDNVPQPSPSTPVEKAPLTTRQWLESWFIRNNPAKWMLATEYDRVSIMCSCLDDFLKYAISPEALVVRCHGCNGTLIYKRNGNEIEVFHNCGRSTPTAQPEDEPYEHKKRRLGYWQCPNDESHILEFFPSWQSRSSRCKTCLVPATFDIAPTAKVAPTPAGDTPAAQPEWKRYVRHLGDCGKESSLADSLSGLCWGISSHKWRDCTCGLAQLMMAPTPAVEVDYEKEVDGFWKAAKKASGNNGRPTAVREWLEDFVSRLRSHDLGGK